MRIQSVTLWAVLAAACNNGGDTSSAGGTGGATTDASTSTQPESTGGVTSTAGSTSTATSTTGSTSTTSTSSTSTDTSSGVSTTSTSSDTSSSTAVETTDTTDSTTTTTGEPASTTDLGETSSGTGDTTGGVVFEGEVCALIMQKCVYSCYMLKWPCIDACIATGSPNGAAEAQAVVNCNYIDCNYDTNCGTSFCLDEWETCVTGPMTCEELVDCAKPCAKDDSVCISRCWYESTKTAKQDYDGLELCRKNQGCAELDDQCMKEFCTWSYMKCLGWP